MDSDEAAKIRPHQHFKDQCRARGITEADIDILYSGLIWARQNDRQDLAEMAKTVEGVEFWRFNCPDGMFFAVFPVGQISPVTVYTREMYRAKLRAEKSRRRHGWHDKNR